MGVWGQRPQQAEACAEGKGSEHASDPCRRHGQKLVSGTSRGSGWFVIRRVVLLRCLDIGYILGALDPGPGSSVVRAPAVYLGISGGAWVQIPVVHFPYTYISTVTMHHTSRCLQLSDKYQKKLVLCHITHDTPVTLVTESLPEKSEHKLKLKNLVAVWGLSVSNGQHSQGGMNNFVRSPFPPRSHFMAR